MTPELLSQDSIWAAHKISRAGTWPQMNKQTSQSLFSNRHLAQRKQTRKLEGRHPTGSCTRAASARRQACSARYPLSPDLPRQAFNCRVTHSMWKGVTFSPEATVTRGGLAWQYLCPKELQFQKTAQKVCLVSSYRMTFRLQDAVLLSWAVCLSGLMSLQFPSQSFSVTLTNSVMSLHQCSLFSSLCGYQPASPPRICLSLQCALFPSEQPLLKLKSNICPQSKEEIGSLRKKNTQSIQKKIKTTPNTPTQR